MLQYDDREPVINYVFDNLQVEYLRNAPRISYNVH